MDLKRLMGILRRQALIVLVAVAVTGWVSYDLARRKPNEYRSSASILLLGPGGATGGTFSAGAGDVSRFAAIQAELMYSPAILEGVVGELGGPPADYSVGTGRTEDILVVTAESALPPHAQATADAVVESYLDYRSEAETAQLRNRADLIEQQTEEAFADLIEIDSSIANLQNVISFGTPEFGQPPDPAIAAAQTELVLLVGQRPSLQARYDALFRQSQELQLQIELQGNSAERLSSAPLPIEPSSPKPRQSLLFGLFAGLILGIGAAAAREQLDTRIRTRKDMEERLGLPVLAELPFDRRIGRRFRGAANDSADNPLREPIRALRTSIEILGMSQPVHRILVTSAVPGEGKTTVVSALGAAFARLGQRVVIVSADLRRPALERYFEIEFGGPGVSDYVLRAQRLSGSGNRVDPGDYVHETPEPDLFVIPSGTPAPNASELLASRGFTELIDVLSEQFDLVLIDSPPMLAVADAAVAARHVDGVLAIASLKNARRDAVQQFANALTSQPARVLGVAINKMRSATASRYGDGYEAGHTKGAPSAPGRKRTETAARRNEPSASAAVVRRPRPTSAPDVTPNGPGAAWAAPELALDQILLVCRANECRSPAAAALLRAELGAHSGVLAVRSAGLSAAGDRRADPVVTRLLTARHVDTSAHRSRSVDAALVTRSGLIVAMTRSQVRTLVADHGAPLARTFTLRELARLAASRPRHDNEPLDRWISRLGHDRTASQLVGDADADDIVDPTGRPEQAYVACLDEIERCIRVIADQMVAVEV